MLAGFDIIIAETVELNKPLLKGLSKYDRKKAKLAAVASAQRTLTGIADKLLASLPEGEEKVLLQQELQLRIFKVREAY